MRYLMTFSYNGKNYNGYQKQPNLKTIQQELEEALTFINNKNKVEIHASGRTDKGVHALGQTAHFDLDVSITPEKLNRAINSNISDAIHVIEVKPVEKDFHARYNAKKKRYVYTLNMGEFNPLEKDFIYQYNRPLNIKAMKEGIKQFIGKHDFEYFVGGDNQKENYVRTIFLAEIKVEQDLVHFIFEGDGFMQYQIRNMVGTLIKIGKEKVESSVISAILEKKQKNIVYCAKPCGLVLEKVIYSL